MWRHQNEADDSGLNALVRTCWRSAFEASWRRTTVNPDADRLATEAHALDPQLPGALSELGYALTLKDRYHEAVDALARGVQIAPLIPQLSIQLGYA